MTDQQMEILRKAIAGRATAAVEMESKGCRPGRLESDGCYAQLVTEAGRTVMDTLNSTVKVIECPDGDWFVDRVGVADLEFVAAAWWGLPLALDQIGLLRQLLTDECQRVERLRALLVQALEKWRVRQAVATPLSAQERELYNECVHAVTGDPMDVTADKARDAMAAARLAVEQMTRELRMLASVVRGSPAPFPGSVASFGDVADRINAIATLGETLAATDDHAE